MYIDDDYNLYTNYTSIRGIGLLPTVEFEIGINNLHINNMVAGF